MDLNHLGTITSEQNPDSHGKGGKKPRSLTQCSIVFVHGLQKGSTSDWKDEVGDFWPVNRLGLDLGTARIFAYGYDQEKLSMRSDELYEGGIIFEHGETLCSDLMQARSADKVSLDRDWGRPEWAIRDSEC